MCSFTCPATSLLKTNFDPAGIQPAHADKPHLLYPLLFRNLTPSPSYLGILLHIFAASEFRMCSQQPRGMKAFRFLDVPKELRLEVETICDK